MKCENCGLANLDHVTRCVKCGRELNSSNSLSNIENLQTYPPRANKLVKIVMNIFYMFRRDINKVPETNTYDSLEDLNRPSFLAELHDGLRPFLISIVPGLGHWTQNRKFIAKIIFCLYISCFLFGVFFYGRFVSNLFFGAMLSIHAISIFDIYNLNREIDLSRRLQGMLLILLVLFSGYYLGYRQITSRIIGFWMPYNYLAPNIKTDDFILAVRRSSVNYGDIVLFSKDRESGRNPFGYENIVIESGNFVDRIIGCPEDTVLIKGKTIYINGGKLDEGRYPLNRTAYLPDMEVKLGKEEYFIYPSTLNRLDRLGVEFIKTYSLVRHDDIYGLLMIYAPMGRIKFLNQ